MGEAASTAIYIMNRSPMKSLQSLTTYESWTGSTTTIEHSKDFWMLSPCEDPRGTFEET